MKKAFPAVMFFALFAVQTILAQNVPADWDTNPPRNTDQYRFAVGISRPSASEQEAFVSARQDAIRQFAESIDVRFQGQTDISVSSQFLASEIEDALTVYLETSSFSTNVPVTGVREQARRIEVSGGRFVARILAVMPTEDFERARRYVENEEAASLAWRFFAGRNLFTVPVSGRPAGYDDFHSWLRNNCVIISIDASSPGPLLEQLDLFLRRLYMNAAVFAGVIDGLPARIIYDSARYYDGIVRALQNFGLFSIRRENANLVLRPIRADILAAFRTAVSEMKDSGLFVITGIETIQTPSGETATADGIVMNHFRTIASRSFNMRAAGFAFPARYLSGRPDEDSIIRHVRNNFAAFPARYLVIVFSEVRLERGMPEFRIPPTVIASVRFVLYDVITGRVIHSDTARTPPGAFSPSSLDDGAVIAESRRALQFLQDPRTRPGLEDIMRNVFERIN